MQSERDKYVGFTALTKEVLETGCKYGAEGIQNFLKGEARQVAKELRIPLDEAEDCINDLLEMEREKLDPFREAKVFAAYQEMVEQWDKGVKPMEQVIEVEPETDDQSLSDEGDETPPEEPFVAVEISRQEQRGGEPWRLRRGTRNRKWCPALAEAAQRTEKDCLLQEMGGECDPEARPEAAEKNAPPLEVFVWRQQGWESVELAADGEGSVLQKLVDDPAIEIDVQQNEAEVHHTLANGRRETGPVAARNDREDEGPSAGEEVRKYLNAAFSVPQDVYSSCRTRHTKERRMFKSYRTQSSPKHAEEALASTGRTVPNSPLQTSPTKPRRRRKE